MRISKKNARIIRRGVEAGKDLVIRNKAGLPVWIDSHASKLEHRAYMHQLHSELRRMTRRMAKRLMEGI